ncbi:H-NS histone family protein [Vibrio cholerae]|jgi:hypothetical protein|uniref:hypothetical protein n=1 Tax=Vibrio cholerae TaxID=666 RepID=UPI0022709DB8|nr:hypothetical protein [Vibrio cholerae]MCX9597637.1 H-NS histone family protein [Vibrio cholerae]
MSRIDEILAKQKALADELEMAKQEERDAVLKDIKEKIKLFNFKTTDFKGVLATRKKRGTATPKKTVAKRTVK